MKYLFKNKPVPVATSEALKNLSNAGLSVTPTERYSEVGSDEVGLSIGSESYLVSGIMTRTKLTYDQVLSMVAKPFWKCNTPVDYVCTWHNARDTESRKLRNTLVVS